MTCAVAKKLDKTFEPDLQCIDESETEAQMASREGFKLVRQLVNTNFVPSIYHASQQLQHQAIRDGGIPLEYNIYKLFKTSVEQNKNMFKDSFFWSSQSETVNAIQFKDG